ncbi:MAG: hypothetical protein II816_06375 [Elusimicrobia bacterium]|nr:hypothetical protein [Elusimicrobiota bacterium]
MMKKTLSLFLSLCIINLVCADIYAGVPSPINTVVPADNIIVSDSFIPVDLGVIVDDIYVGSDKTIINIQDLHADESTQKNIVSILEYLTANYNVGTIYLEGAVKELNFDWLKVIKDEKLRNNVAQKLLSDGKITGAEFFGLYYQKEKVKFYGLADEKVYK